MAHHAKKDQHGIGQKCPLEIRHLETITAIKEVLAQQPPPVQEPSYAGVRMWVGNRHIMQCVTRLEHNHATIGPQRLLEIIAGRCIQELSHD
jgi:hypothetical protein